VAVLGPVRHPEWRELETVSRAFGIQLHPLAIEQFDELATLFQTARNKRVKGLIVVASGQIRFHSLQIVELAAQNQLPVMYPTSNYVDDGGLMAYGVKMTAMSRRAAYYVDRILRGAKPSDLPVEQPMNAEFIINLKAAKQIDLMIPPEVLYRADKVIRDAPG
jgi:putative tryptophan/tyrosine transport system substrate-binding protein